MNRIYAIGIRAGDWLEMRVVEAISGPAVDQHLCILVYTDHWAT